MTCALPPIRVARHRPEAALALGLGMLGWRRAGVVLAAVWLVGCSSPPVVVPPVEPPPPAPIPEPDPLAERIARFESQLNARARQQQQQGLLADSLVSWQALALLRPDQAAYQQQVTSIRQAIAQATATRLARAQAARQRGDLLGAEKAWLEALALDPHLQAAATGLREIEAERNRASVVGRFAQPPGQAGRGQRQAAPPAARATTGPLPAPAPTLQRNLLEHASLLATQGETDAAIALLTDPANGMSRDADGRALLARLLAQRAESRASTDPRAARADLDRAIELDPTLKDLRSRWPAK